MSPRRQILELALFIAATGAAHAQTSPGDLNCDGMLNGRDIAPFVLALVDPLAYAAEFPNCDLSRRDFDCNGVASPGDIVGFIGCLINADCSPCEFPEDMVLIPAGPFQMGNFFTDFFEGDNDELPVHTVHVSDFYIAPYELTNREYADGLNWALTRGMVVVRTVGGTSGYVYRPGVGGQFYCDTTLSDSTYSRITWTGAAFGVTPGKEDYPIVQASWYGAAAYCNWRSSMASRQPCYDTIWECDFARNGYRLPTEAEWEKAARGGAGGRRFPWSDNDLISHRRAIYYSVMSLQYDASPTRGSHPLWPAGLGGRTSPVGFFNGSLRQKADWNWPALPTSYQTADGSNGYGLYDMAGNVSEWCNDRYSDTYYGSSPPIDPRGPATGEARVLRDGFYGCTAACARCASRGWGEPGDRSGGLGFRIAVGN